MDKLSNLKHFSGNIPFFEYFSSQFQFNFMPKFRNIMECKCVTAIEPFIFMVLNPSMKWKNNFNVCVTLNLLNFQFTKTFLNRKTFSKFTWSKFISVQVYYGEFMAPMWWVKRIILNRTNFEKAKNKTENEQKCITLTFHVIA